MTRYLEIKPGSISEVAKKLKEDYQDFFKKELEKTGKSLTSMTDAEKKAFYNRIDKEYNAKNEANEPAKPDDSKTTLVAAPGNKEKVIRIPKEKLADYKAKGYVEAESFVPEAAKEPYAIGMAAAMKQTGDKPPLKKSTITKAHDIAKSIEKKEEVKLEDKNSGGIDALRAIKDKRLRLQGELERLNKDDPNYKEKKAAKQKEIEGQKEIMARKQKEVYGSYDPSRENVLDLNEGELEEGQYKELDTRKGDLKLAKDKKQALKDKYNAIMAGQASGDEQSIGDQIQKLDMSIKKQEQELIDIMKKQKETKKEEVETVEEAAGPDRLTNLNDKITKLQVNLSKLDKSKPESKTKEAIMKADLVTAKLRLQDVIQKRNAETKKESVNEAKKNYKSMKKSVKKEQDKEVNSKRTLTDKPITKVDVDPRIEN
jgi:hypothetical protein